MPLQYPQNTIILKNEQPVEGCHECGILWYQLVNYRNQWRMRPTEIQKQNLFEDAQDAFLEHYKEQHQEPYEECEECERLYRLERHEFNNLLDPNTKYEEHEKAQKAFLDHLTTHKVTPV